MDEGAEAKQQVQPRPAANVDTPKVVCSACYVPLTSRMQCGKCKKRFYCSKSCQLADWKSGGHKRWCGRAGENGFDFEIRATNDKGLGMFALRSFRVGEKILAEPPVLSSPRTSVYTRIHQAALKKQLLALSPSLIQAIIELHPSEGPLMQKFAINCVGADDDVTRMFLKYSRINHACLPTCGHGYLVEHGVMLINATQAIAVGQELTISYNHKSSVPLSNWNFECHCHACSNPALGAKLARVKKMDAQIEELGSNGKEVAAYALGETRLQLLKELGFGDDFLFRTYHDMFQMAVRRQETMAKAKRCIQRALECAILSEGENPDSKSVKKFRSLARDLTGHPQFLALRESDVQMRRMGMNPMR